MKREGAPVSPLWPRGALLERDGADLGLPQVLVDRTEAAMRPACDDREVPLVWQRFCPLCARQLTKQEMTDLFRCPCGWRG